VDIIKGLDWKWAFGVHLWFFELVDVPIAHVFSAYNQVRREFLECMMPDDASPSMVQDHQNLRPGNPPRPPSRMLSSH
jgi:nuclear pore complex protein Nup98-Nup96